MLLTKLIHAAVLSFKCRYSVVELQLDTYGDISGSHNMHSHDVSLLQGAKPTGHVQFKNCKSNDLIDFSEFPQGPSAKKMMVSKLNQVENTH